METEAPVRVGPRIGDRLSNGAWCLDARQTHFGGELNKWVVLAFHSGAGAEAPFATSRCDAFGNVNPMTYSYFATLPYATFDFTYERG